jgi:hypothetical protein
MKHGPPENEAVERQQPMNNTGVTYGRSSEFGFHPGLCCLNYGLTTQLTDTDSAIK